MDRGVFWGVFWGFLAASAVSGAIAAVFMVVLAVSARHDAQVAIDHLHEQAVTASRDRAYHRREDARVAASRAAAARDFRRRQQASRVLSDAQKCVGHTVVDVRGNSYTQRIRDGQPVSCHGRLADQPFRL